MSKTLEPILRKHPFFAGMADGDLRLVTGCAKNVRFDANAVLAKDGQAADEFFVIREGSLAVGIASPQGGRLLIETLDAGEVVGWSWLFPPHVWQFDIVAVTPVRVLSMDGRCLREKCDAEPRLGYDLMKRFSSVISKRLAATRLQLLDIYAGKETKPGAISPT
ncbi:MAG: cyclic nucleotide-binding domain-containing protein [Verrucomicrobiales bacterium]